MDTAIYRTPPEIELRRIKFVYRIQLSFLNRAKVSPQGSVRFLSIYFSINFRVLNVLKCDGLFDLTLERDKTVCAI